MNGIFQIKIDKIHCAKCTLQRHSHTHKFYGELPTSFKYRTSLVAVLKEGKKTTSIRKIPYNFMLNLSLPNNYCNRQALRRHIPKKVRTIAQWNVWLFSSVFCRSASTQKNFLSLVWRNRRSRCDNNADDDDDDDGCMSAYIGGRDREKQHSLFFVISFNKRIDNIIEKWFVRRDVMCCACIVMCFRRVVSLLLNAFSTRNSVPYVTNDEVKLSTQKHIQSNRHTHAISHKAKIENAMLVGSFRFSLFDRTCTAA